MISKTIATMKNLFKNLMLVAVAAMGFTACEQVNDDVNATNETFTVNIVGDFADDTRSGFVGSETNDGKTFYKSAWDGSETAVFSVDEATLVSATNTYTDGGNKALFAPVFTTTGSTIYAFSPKYVANKCLGGVSGINTKYRDVYVAIPSEQTPEAVSVDPAAHILAGEAEFAETVDMSFSHVLAYGKMTITNFDSDIKKVVITTDNKPLVGSSCYYYYADNTDGKSKGDLANVSECSLTINADNVVDNVFWFGCAPADLTGTTLKVKIYSGEDTYTRNVEISKTLKFQQGRVASFNISFAGIEKDVVTVDWVNNAYNLVKSAAHLEVGDQVVIAAAKSNYAMGATRGSNNSAISVVKNDNGTIDFDSEVLVLTLYAGKKEGTYAFKHSAGYLYAASSSSNHLKTEANLSDNSSFTIEIDENGIATIKAQGSYTRNWMRFNSTNTPPIFSCYGSGQADICIYKMVGEYAPEVPAISYTINNISIAYDATSGEAEVTATNGDGWAFSATTDADWVDELVYADSKISFVVDTNDSEESREATVTVKATKADYDDVIVTFTITQGAKPAGGTEQPGDGTPKFVKVTSAPSDWSGTYLIVYETGKVAFNGSLTKLDAGQNRVSVTINNNEIEATQEMLNISFTIEPNSNQYTIKSASGYYIGATSNSNSLVSNTSTKYNNTISFTSANEITIKGSGGAYLRYNANSGTSNERFRYYKSSSYTSQKAIQLYKLSE